MKLDIQKYWNEPPPEPSPGLVKWLAKAKAGWRPNRRIGGMDYFSKAEYFNVYIWEWLNVLEKVMYEN